MFFDMAFIELAGLVSAYVCFWYMLLIIDRDDDK